MINKIITLAETKLTNDKTMESVDKIESGICSIIKRNDGIIQFDFKDDAIIYEHDMRLMISNIAKITERKKHPMLIVTGAGNDATVGARKLSLKNLKAKDYSLAEAVVVKSSSTNVAAKFFYKTYAPNHPYKTFDNIEEAELWLQQFIMN